MKIKIDDEMKDMIEKLKNVLIEDDNTIIKKALTSLMSEIDDKIHSSTNDKNEFDEILDKIDKEKKLKEALDNIDDKEILDEIDKEFEELLNENN